MSCSRYGQHALELPSSSSSKGGGMSPSASLSTYPLDASLKAQRKNLSSSIDAGVEVLKVSKNGKLHPRRVAFSPDHRSIYVTTNRFRSVKGFFKYALQTSREVTARTIDIGAIDHILYGQQTKRFHLARAVALSTEGDAVMKLMLDSEAFSFSLVYRVSLDALSNMSPVAPALAMMDAATNHTVALSAPSHGHGHGAVYETLDLILPNQEAYERLQTTIRDLFQLHQQERKRYSRNILLLQHHWMELGKQLQESLSANEWMILSDRLNLPMTKTDHMRLFKNYEKQLNEGERMIFTYVGEILEDIETETILADDPYERLWNDIVATDPIPAVKVGNADDDASLELAFNDEEEEETISAIAFLSFIRSQQKQFSTSLEDVVKLVHTLNNQVTWDDLEGKERFDMTQDTRIAAMDRLGKSRFIAYIMSDANDFMDVATAIDDMTQPLSHYWINTSHDTYLQKAGPVRRRLACADTGVHVLEDTDEQMYLYALQRGVRCLELDLWDGVTGQPVISRLEPSSADKAIPLAVVLRTIRSFLQCNPSSWPVILRIENHCSYETQQRVAQQLQKIVGASGLLATPKAARGTVVINDMAALPSPQSIRGKVLILGKRPAIIEEGAKVVKDDFDDDNFISEEDLARNAAYDEDETDDLNQQIIGFTSSGPVTSMSSLSPGEAPPRSLEEVFDAAVRAADAAKQAAGLAESRAARLQYEADEAEKLAAQLTQEAGLTPAQVKSKAAASSRDDGDGVEVQWGANGILSSNPQGEGLEVQEFLHDEVKGSRSRYSSVIGEAIKASEEATVRLTNLHNADAKLREAESNLHHARQREKDLAEQSRRAAVDTRSNREHAESAKRRVETVRDLLQKCEDNANSARTVVVTATTEAKISERRASDAEARATRALASSERDRTRADDETRKEEQFEQAAAGLHGELTEATKVARLARERVEKAAAMLDRVDEQIALIEASDQYKKELKREAGSFVAKHTAKIEERELVKTLIKEASNENARAESIRRSCQEKFEERAQMWKIQVDIASQLRKQADRSSMVAEELAEHAEEEREAATLRHIAREKAEANVQQRGAHLDSVRAQLAEAERAAVEAASAAVDSRKRADSLAREAEKATHYGELIRVVEQCKVKRQLALEAYDNARAAKDQADAVASDTKRLLETNAELYTSAVRDAAAENHRAHTSRLCERKAVIAFNRALLTRKQADHAKALSRIAMATSQEKTLAAKRALEYKEKTSKISQIPVLLAEMTWLHASKHKYWDKSLNLPLYHVLSIPLESLAASQNKDPGNLRSKLVDFTKSHLCRTFPSGRLTKSNSLMHSSPVLSWALGCQVVAVDYHSSSDEQLILADGRFRQNGSCGYVLKPSHLLMEKTPSTEKHQRWKIRVLRGSYLPKPESRCTATNNKNGSISPFVKVAIYDGVFSSTQSPAVPLVHTTKSVRCNGLHPVWNDPEGMDVKVLRPSVAMICISVWDKTEAGTEDFIAGAACSVAQLRQGYRSVALFDSNHTRSGAFAFASLLVNFQKL